VIVGAPAGHVTTVETRTRKIPSDGDLHRSSDARNWSGDEAGAGCWIDLPARNAPCSGYRAAVLAPRREVDRVCEPFHGVDAIGATNAGDRAVAGPRTRTRELNRRGTRMVASRIVA
jgi:hypothetical protein